MTDMIPLPIMYLFYLFQLFGSFPFFHIIPATVQPRPKSP